MKQIRTSSVIFLAVLACFLFSSCSKSGNSSNTTPVNNSSLFPLAVNNAWNYKLRQYNTSTGATIDSSYFTLSITGTFSADGFTYYQFQNSADTTTLQNLTAINATTLGSTNDAFGAKFFTFFAVGSGDSTQAVSSWPVNASETSTPCEGTDKLYAFYADTTLVNVDGTVYANAKKNVIVTYDCSGNKLTANLYYIKEGVGLVRYLRYIYAANGDHLLELAWVLESQTLVIAG